MSRSVYIIDDFESDIDVAIDDARSNYYHYVLAPFDSSDIKKSSQAIINLKHQLSQDAITVLGVVDGRNMTRKRLSEWVKWLDLNGVSGYWVPRWERRGVSAVELKWEGMSWSMPQYVKGWEAYDPTYWPFATIGSEDYNNAYHNPGPWTSSNE